MKTKLLKKIRKRFEIIHMPNGLISNGDIYEYNLFVLKDSTNSYYSHYSQCGHKESERQFCSPEQIFSTEKECIDYLKSVIINRLIGEGYEGVKSKKIKKSYKKV